MDVDGVDGVNIQSLDADGDRATPEPELHIAMVWKASTQVLGMAFMEGTVLRFCEIADTAPEFQNLQSIKFALRPDVIVAPSSADPTWITALGIDSILLPGAMSGPDGDEQHPGDQAPDKDSGPQVVRSKNRDFVADVAAKRLSLLRTLTGLPDCDMMEREVLLYVEHMVPREHEQARRAISGLLSYMQRMESGAPLVVSALRRYSLESQLYMSPESFMSLNIFSDDRHPSAHGGRTKVGLSMSPLHSTTVSHAHTALIAPHCCAKEGFSVWSILNRTKTKPGERLLKGWFRKPTQDLETLRERHDAIEYLSAPQTAQLLSQLHALVGRMKDVTKLEASLSRGGLRLSDYSAVIATSSYAVKVKQLLIEAEVPTELPAIARAISAFDDELETTSNTIGCVIDRPASAIASKHSVRASMGRKKHHPPGPLACPKLVLERGS